MRPLNGREIKKNDTIAVEASVCPSPCRLEKAAVILLIVKLLQILDSFTVAVNKSVTDKQVGCDVVKLSIRSCIPDRSCARFVCRCAVLYPVPCSLTGCLDALALRKLCCQTFAYDAIFGQGVV